MQAQCLTDRRSEQILAHFEQRQGASWAETEEGRADALYAPYVERQQREWSAVQRDLQTWIPANFDFGAVPGLSNEMVERLANVGPETIDQASRIAGITPAALSALYVAAGRWAA